MPESETNTRPSLATAMSFRNVAPGTAISPLGAPLLASNLRTTVMSDTYKMPPLMPVPFGASSLAVLNACPPTSERCRNGARTPTILTASVVAIAIAMPRSTVRL